MAHEKKKRISLNISIFTAVQKKKAKKCDLIWSLEIEGAITVTASKQVK